MRPSFIHEISISLAISWFSGSLLLRLFSYAGVASMQIKTSRSGWIGALFLAMVAGAAGIALLQGEGDLDAGAEVAEFVSPPREKRPIPNIGIEHTYTLPENDGDAARAAAALAVSKSAVRDSSDDIQCSGDGEKYAEFVGADSPFLDKYVGAEVEPGIYISSFEGSNNYGRFLVCVEAGAPEGFVVADFETSGLSATSWADDVTIGQMDLNGLEIPLPILATGSSFGAYLAAGGVAAASTAAVIKVRTEKDPPISR